MQKRRLMPSQNRNKPMPDGFIEIVVFSLIMFATGFVVGYNWRVTYEP